jgi:hypothetical protein
MVAGGITGEVLASMIAHLCQGELTRRTKKELGEAKERAANAERETERLRALMAPRRLSLEQMQSLFEKISEFKGQSVGVGPNPVLPESQVLCRLLLAVFDRAGWKAEAALPVHMPLYPGGVVVASTNDEKGRGTAVQLAAALNSVGIFSTSAPLLEQYADGPDPAWILVIVGVKPEAEAIEAPKAPQAKAAQ